MSDQPQDDVDNPPWEHDNERVNRKKASNRRAKVNAKYPSFKTPAVKLSFLEHLRKGYSVTAACERVGATTRAAYSHRDVNPEFAEQWDDAVEAGADLLEDTAVKRAVEGTERTLMSNGVKIGSDRIYNDNLLMFLLEGKKPERYRKRMDVTSGGKDIVQSFASALLNLPQYAPPSARPKED